MSSQVWAIEVMMKYHLTVDFNERIIRTPCGLKEVNFQREFFYSTLQDFVMDIENER